ncbi:hypothetical protein FA13DRAFT_1735885 [Coprinellus micaceus]|uniref:F-box domain-containing protein n=1 Tax=Coprinellus micaceus TaxID=71717 RepID=A0A4Y7T276_COPMI|nr:hypothetical protein FA13DRAFT_1735885 [Coprinellus micaceus]
MDANLVFLQRPSNNQPPLDDELFRIRSFRQDCQARIDALHQQILRLREQSELLETDLGRYDLLLAPVKRVPEDVLSAIFQHISTPGTNIEDFRPFDWQMSPPAVMPSQICQDWRRLALLTPPLWATIPIMAPGHPVVSKSDSDPPHAVERAVREWEARIQQLLEICALWIERSKQNPLSIIIRLNAVGRRGREGPPATAFPLYLDLVSLVCRVALRWKTLDLNINVNDIPILNTLVALQSDDVPQLEVVSCQTGGTRSIADSVLAHLDLFMGNRLRSFTMFKLRESWPGLSINWAAVKELRLGVEGRSWREGDPLYRSIEKSFGPDAIRSMLLMCPNLERWELSVQPGNGHGAREAALPTSVTKDSRENVRHPHLKSLIFHGSQPSEALTSSLDFPSLQQLHCLGGLVAKTGKDGRATLSHCFLFLINRYGAQLTDLRFSHLLLNDMPSITQCFGNLPNVLSLHLDGGVPTFDESTKGIVTNFSSAAVAILVALTPDVREGEFPATEVPLCPNLKRFTYQPTILCFTENQFLEFVIGRSYISSTTNIVRIEEVDVRFVIPQEMDISKELKSRGVDVDHLTLLVEYPRRREGGTIVTLTTRD